MNVLIVDGTCPKPYDPQTLATEGMGGTEATVIRISEALGRSHPTTVEQHNRTEYTEGKEPWTHYAPADSCVEADVVISLRYPALLPLMQKRFPNARHLFWCHDLAMHDYCEQLIQMSGFETICVSNFHKQQYTDMLRQHGYKNQFPIHVLYNPIPDDLTPDGTSYDKNKLIWTSSPHKGLDYGLSVFSELYRRNPDFRLYVANPGYLPSHAQEQEGVIALGSLPHSQLLIHLRSSLCLLYPNTVFPETFGIVLAEANAVGTPVIANAMGAAPEVLYHPNEFTDCRHMQVVVDRVMAWHNGERPKVRCKPQFRLSNVIKAWERFLGAV